MLISNIYHNRSNKNGILVNGPASFVDCQTALPITVRGALYCTNSTINANVVHYTVSTPAFVRMQGCTLNAYYSLNPAVANSTVNAVWANNYSSVDSPILIDRTYLDPIDSHHTYTYANNSGGFLPYVVSNGIQDYTIKHIGLVDKTTAKPERVILQEVIGGSDDDRNGRPSGYSYPYAYSNYFETIRMFRVGVDPIPVRCEVLSYPTIWVTEGSSGEYQHNRICEAYLGAYFISGYSWGIQPYWDDMTAPINSRSFANRSPMLARGSLSFSLNNMPSFSDYTYALELRYECLDRHD